MNKTSFINKTTYRKHLTFAIVLSALLFGSLLFYVGMIYASPDLSYTTVVMDGSMVTEYSFVMFKDDSTYYARNGLTGTVTSSTNATGLIQTCVTSFGIEGGSIAFRGEAEDPFLLTHSVVIENGVASIMFKGDRQVEVLKLADNADCDMFQVEEGVRQISWIDLGLDGNEDNQASVVHGIHFLTGSGTASNDCHVKNCIIVNFKGHGIYVEGELSASEFNANYIEDNDAGTGIYAYNLTNSMIQGNYLWGLGGFAICLNGTGAGECIDNTIADNFISGNGLGGIYMENGAGSVIAGNFINGNKEGLKLVSTQSLTVTGNEIRASWESGINCQYLRYSVISSNAIIGSSYKYDDTYNGIYMGGWSASYKSTYNIVSSNSISSTGISNQTKYGIFEDSSYADYNLYIGDICTGSDTVNIYPLGTNSEVHDCFNGTSYIS